MGAEKPSMESRARRLSYRDGAILPPLPSQIMTIIKT